MDFRELNYVIAIAEHGSISKAAEVLLIAQPSLSKFLQNLESELGVQLFERIARRMKPTDAGEQYLLAAYRIRALGSELRNTMNDYASRRRGSLVIGSTHARSKYVTTNTFPQFKKLYPEFRLHVSEMPNDELERALRAGLIDLAIYIITRRSEEFAYHHICTEEVVLAMSADNPHAGEGVSRPGARWPWIDLRKLADQPFLMPPEVWRVSRMGAQLLEEYGMQPEVIRMSSTEASVALANRGLGVCFCSSMMDQCFEDKRKPLYFSIGEPATEAEFVIATRKSMPLTRAVRDYISIVRGVFGEGERAPAGG